ncbi:MAG: rhomboid family intramembrane serine protease [Gammaproteobacteria bacterium]|nr:rhomboid family intramembrane serine protease [Gammaproteobacteria bacterium]
MPWVVHNAGLLIVVEFMLHVALEVSAEEDLRPLSAWLSARGVPHRIFEVSGRLRLQVPDERFQALVDEGWAAQSRGELPDAVVSSAGGGVADGVLALAQRNPLCIFLVVVTLLCYPATSSLPESLSVMLRAMLIVPTEQVGDFIQFTTLEASLRAGQIWRLWTPALLHFSVLHLAFNLLWLWEFGRRIEDVQGRGRLLEVVLILAPVANVAQWLVGDGPMFGGLSGVVYGLLGYLIVAGRRTGDPNLTLPPALIVILLVFLVLFSTGVTSAFGLHIANAAHWGGFIAGVLWGLLRLRSVRPTAGGGSNWQA